MVRPVARYRLNPAFSTVHCSARAGASTAIVKATSIAHPARNRLPRFIDRRSPALADDCSMHPERQPQQPSQNKLFMRQGIGGKAAGHRRVRHDLAKVFPPFGLEIRGTLARDLDRVQSDLGLHLLQSARIKLLPGCARRGSRGFGQDRLRLQRRLPASHQDHGTAIVLRLARARRVLHGFLRLTTARHDQQGCNQDPAQAAPSGRVGNPAYRSPFTAKFRSLLVIRWPRVILYKYTVSAAPTMQPSYAELHCISNFSFLRGASHPHELIERALALGYTALAITDECSFAGSVRAHLALREACCELAAAREFCLIHGTEIRLAGGPQLLLLAQTRTGYGNLSELVTLARRAAAKGEYRLTADDLAAQAHLLDHTLALLVPEPAPPSFALRASEGKQRQRPTEADIEKIELDARWLHQLLPGRSWIACELTRGPDDAAWLATLRQAGQRAGVPLVAAGAVHMHVRSRKKLQDALTAVRLRTPLAQCGRHLAPNAERHLRPLYRLGRIYPAELLAQTLAIAERCTFCLDELRYEYPDEIAPSGQTPAAY